jgi:hypothetical protein
MIKLATARVLGSRLGLKRDAFKAHIERGTVTEPFGFVENAGGRTDYFWTSDSAPTLDLLGATALVPASEEIALQEVKEGFYATPCQTNGHLGRYDNFPALGLCHKSRTTIYPVIRSIRIGFLDPVREQDNYWWIDTSEGDRIIDRAELSVSDRETLRAVCRSRAALVGEADGLMVDPRAIAVYRLDVDNPIARDVVTESTVLGATWTVDPIDESTTSVGIYKLDQVANWARES